jgi:hypothetical protein
MLIDENAKTMFKDSSLNSIETISKVTGRAKSSLREYKRKAVHSKIKSKTFYK